MGSDGYWIDPAHLGDACIAAYRAQFLAHPARMLVLPDFLVGRHARALAEVMHDADYERVRGLASGEWVSEERFLDLAAHERLYQYERPVRVATDLLAPSVVTYVRLRNAFAVDPQLCRFFERVTDLPLAPSPTFDMHRMAAGDYLARHTDRVDPTRSLALVLYLNEVAPAAGGTLLVHDVYGGTTAVQPAFNSLVMFDVRAHAGHEVTPVAAGAQPRLSVSGWYLDLPADAAQA